MVNNDTCPRPTTRRLEDRGEPGVERGAEARRKGGRRASGGEAVAVEVEQDDALQKARLGRELRLEDRGVHAVRKDRRGLQVVAKPMRR
jgi:hypothetical protein